MLCKRKLAKTDVEYNCCWCIQLVCLLTSVLHVLEFKRDIMYVQHNCRIRCPIETFLHILTIKMFKNNQ